MDSRVRELGILLLTVTAAIGNFLIFGLAHYRTWSDASEYNAYALNILHSGIFGFDGAHFDVAREPGYPLFLAAVYRLFGDENLLAVCFIQAIILGVMGYVVYRIFKEYDEKTVGIFAGIAVSAHPSYGYYANEILTELLFAFILIIAFYICVRIVRAADQARWYWFLALGLLSGYGTLTRSQLLLFLPFLVIVWLIWRRSMNAATAKHIGITLSAFAIVVCAWGFYVQKNIGHFAITEGRQELALNIRAVRARLSYRELTQYAFEWLMRSVSGGKPYALLDHNEARGITERYYAIATTSEAAARIKAENMEAIRSHPGEYIYGNLIELMKMSYIEHDYTDSQSRYFRPAVYALTYLLFLFGVFQVLYRWREYDMRTLAMSALIFPLYNYIVLSFLDTVPRFNTPYLAFYVIVGFAGIALWMHTKETRKRI